MALYSPRDHRFLLGNISSQPTAGRGGERSQVLLAPPQPSLRSRCQSPRPAWSCVLGRVAGPELQNYPGELGSPGGFENLSLKIWEENAAPVPRTCTGSGFCPQPLPVPQSRGVWVGSPAAPSSRRSARAALGCAEGFLLPERGSCSCACPWQMTAQPRLWGFVEGLRRVRRKK